MIQAHTHHWQNRLIALLCLHAAFGCAAGTGSNAETRDGVHQSTALSPPANSNTQSPSSSPSSSEPNNAASTLNPPTGTTPVASPNATLPSAPTEPSVPTDSSSPNGLLCGGTLGRRVAVDSAAALSAALAAAKPMDVITLAPGTYEGSFVAKAVATSQAPIALCGSADTILHGPSLTTGYTLYLQDAQYWQVVGLTVSGGAKGIMLDRASFNTIQGVTVTGIGSEGIHLRTNSHDNLVDGCHVSKTGTAGNPKFGEGIYIGSSMNNWCTLTQGQADKSDRNTIQNCDVSQTTSENIDIKEGTSNGTIINNTLDGTGIDLTNATSLVNVKGNSYRLHNNKAKKAPEDAFSIHVLLAGWGACNQFQGNSAQDALSGYGIHLAAGKPWPATAISADNSFSSATMGMTNAPVGASITAADTCISSITSVTCAE